jgi:hypothetical protein
VLPLAPGPPVVQSFWLAALAAVILRKWPSGVPPAWAAGREIRWPTRQEMVEKAAQERERRQGGGAAEPETATAAAPVPTAGRTRASSARKRKRKKRR